MSLQNHDEARSFAKFNHKKRPTTHHPWERCVRGHNLKKLKYAHNSVHNPEYPKKSKPIPDIEKVKFTIVGDRVTKEYNYCANIAFGLYKYRSKVFDAPIITGVTTVEWPQVLNDLKIKYGGLAYCLDSCVAIILNDKFLGGEKEFREIINSKYNYHIILDYYKEGVDQFVSYVRSSGRPCAYMHISIDSFYIGTLIFMLYADIVPNTCINFLRLCQAKKGGYSGTPIHRIVKDCWIQCGGYGLKSIELDCENFVIPHDRRGVLGMANDGRHVDCSTQFFVLLQPAPWMFQKYVAFGQLIDGESVLQNIESIPTWYESPVVDIQIQDAGLLNLECQDITINKCTKEYINGHIEDLVILGNVLIEEIMAKTFLEIELRELALEEQMRGEGEEERIEEEKNNIRATRRFIRKKEEIEKQLQKSHVDQRRPSAAVSEALDENNDFDVEVYDYEPEEHHVSEPYQHISLGSIIEKEPEERLYYIPLTDVPYPGEVDSTFDLKKFLVGDYCLESDLHAEVKKKVIGSQFSYVSDIYKFDESDEGSVKSLESEEEREIRRYLKLNVDRVSFAGDVIKGIARGVGQFNIFEGTRRSELITDEELRRFRLQSVDRRSRDNGDKKVSISIPWGVREPSKIKRRQTGFVRTEDLEKIHIIQRLCSRDALDSDESLSSNRKVRIAQSAVAAQTGSKPVRRPTGFVKPAPVNFSDSDMEVRRQSVLTRLYENVTADDENGPTLKEYRPLGEAEQRNLMLTYSPNSRIKSDENTREKYFRASVTVEEVSYNEVMNLQHSKKVARKISSDYVKTIDQMEHKTENSIRSVEYAKNRPSLSVSEYQAKNLKYEQDQKTAQESQETRGLRLPGDTPLYSMSEASD